MKARGRARVKGKLIGRGFDFAKVRNSKPLHIEAGSRAEPRIPLRRGEVNFLRTHQAANAATLVAVGYLVAPFFLPGQYRRCFGSDNHAAGKQVENVLTGSCDRRIEFPSWEDGGAG